MTWPLPAWCLHFGFFLFFFLFFFWFLICLDLCRKAIASSAYWVSHDGTPQDNKTLPRFPVCSCSGVHTPLPDTIACCPEFCFCCDSKMGEFVFFFLS
jgi:hypothetical protein